MLRQFDAVLGTGSLLGYSKAITAPTVVLHGSADPMVRPRNGRAVAAAIPGARFVVVDGMGHDLPEPVWRADRRDLAENFARATLITFHRLAERASAAIITGDDVAVRSRSAVAIEPVSGLTRIGT